MTAIGIYEAKSRFTKLLERVAHGERFLITKDGRPVAQLVPAAEEPTVDLKKIILKMEKWQSGKDLPLVRT
jgi:prevent-host-death family protein